MNQLILFISAIVAGLAALLGYGWRQRARGRKDAAADSIKDLQERLERGRDAVADIDYNDRAKLLERLRKNDGRW